MFVIDNNLKLFYIIPNRMSKHLKDMTGSELFTLTSRDLEHYFGIVEGKRLDDELIRSRNASSVSKNIIFMNILNCF